MNRTMLFRVGITLSAWVCAGMAAAQDGPPAQFRQVAPDLYFNYDYDGSNSTVLITDEGVLIVDTRTHPDAAELLLVEIRKRTDAPIRYVINSQHHGDHYMGNVVFEREGATFIAHEDTKAEIVQRFPSEVVTRFAARDEDPSKVVLVLPDIVFSDRLTLELGGRTVELIYLGPGQNEGDTMVYFPHARALQTGGVFHNQSWANTSFTPSMDGWVDVLRKMRAIDAEIYLPPHGDLATAADVDAFTDFIDKLGTSVRAGIDEGRSLEQILDALTFEDYADWRGYDRRRRNLTQIYELMAGKR